MLPVWVYGISSGMHFWASYSCCIANGWIVRRWFLSQSLICSVAKVKQRARYLRVKSRDQHTCKGKKDQMPPFYPWLRSHNFRHMYQALWLPFVQLKKMWGWERGWLNCCTQNFWGFFTCPCLHLHVHASHVLGLYHVTCTCTTPL